MSSRTLRTGAAAMLCGLTLASDAAAQSPRVVTRHERPGVPVETSDGDSEPTAARVSGPVLGYVLYEGSQLRPVYGVPGAAVAGVEVSGMPELGAAAVCSVRGYVVGARAGEAGLVLIRDLGARLSIMKLPGAAEHVVLSPSGSAAAAYSSREGSLTVYRGLPDEPEVAWSATPAGRLSVLAVRDDGGAVLAATADSLIRLTPGGGWDYLGAAAGPVSAQFLTGGGDAVVADAGLKRVYRIRETAGGAELLPLAGESDGVSSPVAVAASADNRRVLVANAEPGGVLSIGLEGGEAAFVGCACAPSRLARLSGDAVFQLTEADGGPVYVFDGDGPEARVTFIPAPAGIRARRGGAR